MSASLRAGDDERGVTEPDTEPHAVVDVQTVGGAQVPPAPETRPPLRSAETWAEVPPDPETSLPLGSAEAWADPQAGDAIEPGLDPALRAAIQQPDYEPYADPGPVPDDIPLAEEEPAGAAHAGAEVQVEPSWDAPAPPADAVPAAPVAQDPPGPAQEILGSDDVAAYEGGAAFEPPPAPGAVTAPEPAPAAPDPDPAVYESLPAPNEPHPPVDESLPAMNEPHPPVDDSVPAVSEPVAPEQQPAPVLNEPHPPLHDPAAAQPAEAIAAPDAVAAHVAAWDPVATPGVPLEPAIGAAADPVSDPQGAAGPNVTVSAREPGARTSRPRTTRSSGGRVPPPPAVPGRPGSGGPRRRPRRGRPSSSARLLAVVGLVIVAALVFVLVRSLRHTSTPKAPPAPAVVHVLIPEGLTRLQIAEVAAKDGLKGDYRLASRAATVLSPQEYGAPASTHDLEGFLFPATYDEFPGASVNQLVTDQLTAFKENLPTDIVARARALHLSVYDVLIVASMVEREAKLPADRAKVAAVIYNRLRRGMPLAIDATLYYAIELKKDVPTYTAELTEEQLHMSSAYNTRVRTGLPPTPISNPGAAAIAAAANPAPVPYLYYVNGADGCGELVFSKTMAEFERNASAYQAAVAANHGKPPTCKHK